MLKILPDTPARTQQELELQLALGSVLRMVKGHMQYRKSHPVPVDGSMDHC
jgi:hypothetical protein